MKDGIRNGCFFILILVIQAVAFYHVDPLGYPDTIRYINFADFLQHPRDAHFGDLAHNNGILFTPLFLPFFLAVLKKAASIPYISSGVFLQIVSFWSIIWLSYMIALRIDCKKTAILTAALLSTHLVFYFRSVFILTNYPFMAVLLLIVFYIVSNELFNVKRTVILSLLFALLISMRVQGLLPAMIIAVYLLISARLSPGKLAILCLAPLAYLLFYIGFYSYLNGAFPSTLAMNEIFSMNTFFMGDKFADYNFSLHGLEALIPQKALPYNFNSAAIYISLITMRISEFVQFLNMSLKHYYPFFTILVCMALIFSKARCKALLASLILLNFIATILFLTPYYAVLRYQESIFPLVMILIASSFVHIRDGVHRKTAAGVCILFFAILLYAGYFTMRHYKLFKFFSSDGEKSRVVLRMPASDSARLIMEKIGCGHKVMVPDPEQYNIVYRSGNAPVYFFDGWQRQAIEDYIKTRGLRYFIGKIENIDRLKEEGMQVRVICPIIEMPGATDSLLFCEFSQ